MGTQLNIKSEDAYRLASRISELTGESLTSVVIRALQAELARKRLVDLRRQRVADGVAKYRELSCTHARS